MSEPEDETRPLRVRAYDAFTDRLLARDIEPGQFVTQRQLVGITGMPLGAIREMIPRLEAEGIIRTVPQRGMQVAHVDLDLIRNAFQLRLILEREALSHFCRTAADAEIAQIRAAHLAIASTPGQAATPAQVERAQTVDWSFHKTLIDSLGNELISAVSAVNSIKIRLIRNRATRILPELMDAVLTEHMAIIDALAARDEAVAVAALEAHIGSARRRALGL